MSNINVFLRDNLSKLSEKRVYITPNIPDKHLNNLVKSTKYSGSIDSVVGLLDITVFGNGSDGLLFTGEQLIYKGTFQSPIVIKYEDIQSIDYILHSKKNENIGINFNLGDRSVEIKDIELHCHIDSLKNLIDEITLNFNEFNEEKQIVPLEEMSEELKFNYLKIIINMAYDNDQVIDQKELAEIFLLINRISLTQATRFAIRNYIFDTSIREETSNLFNSLDSYIPSGQEKTVHVSLTKDLINLYFATQNKDLSGFKFFHENRHLLNITDEDIELVVMALETDYKLLDGNFSDEKIKSAFKELSAKAAAVGTPLAAVYLSGSVIGMSATGMTSGLAMLGMGGVLGLSSMATGIGVAVLIGLGAYQGVKKITGSNELNQYQRKQLMLNEVIKQTQSSISALLNDINYITEKLNIVLLQQNDLSEQNEKYVHQNKQLVSMIKILRGMSGAGNILNQKANQAESETYKLSCPQYLDLKKLESLTSDPTKKKYFDYITGFYIEAEVEQHDEDKLTILNKLVINPELSQQYENLSKIFELIGYFKTADVLKGKTKQLISGFTS